jgi:hypothetical protein
MPMGVQRQEWPVPRILRQRRRRQPAAAHLLYLDYYTTIQSLARDQGQAAFGEVQVRREFGMLEQSRSQSGRPALKTFRTPLVARLFASFAATFLIGFVACGLLFVTVASGVGWPIRAFPGACTAIGAAVTYPGRFF